MKENDKGINWNGIFHSILVSILTFYINFYLVSKLIMTDVPDIGEGFKSVLSADYKFALISILGLSLYLSQRITRSFVYKLITASITYFIATYFIFITRNLNNKHFNPFAFKQNNILQYNGLYLIIAIVIFSLVLKWLLVKFDGKNRLSAFFEDFTYDNLLGGLIISFLAFSQNDVTVFFQQSIPNLTDGNNVLPYIIHISLVTIIVTATFTVISASFLRTFRYVKRLRSSLSLAFITSILLAIIFNYFLQFGVKLDSDLLGHYIFPGATSYQLLVLTLIFFSIYIITNRYLASTLFIIPVFSAIAIANILKEKMRSEPLLITDFLWLKELSTVLSFVDKKITIYIIIAILAPLLVYFLIKRTVEITPIIEKLSLRIGILSMLLFTFFGIYSVFKNEDDGKINNNIPILSVVNNWQNIEWMGFDVNARYKSMAYVWTKQLTKSIIEKPSNYSSTKMLEIAKKYNIEAQSINENRNRDISNQTVIYILSESFSNPKALNKISTSKDLIPQVEQIKENTTSGKMKSDGFGGGTANMEFQTLTGLPYYNFSTGVSTLYTEVVPKMKVFPSISDYYKSTNRIVMHPSSASNYSRLSIYKQLGFGHLIFSEGTDEKFEYIEKVGVNMSDQSLFNNVISKIETNKSQFFSVITMQNHAPWSVGSPTDVTAIGSGFTNDENSSLTEYARLLTYSDSATKEFLDKLTNIEKDITVVFYGDHLPGLYPNSTFENEKSKKYQTDYFIWSNHYQNKTTHSLVNSSDFTAALFEHTNSRVSPYYALLTSVLNNASVDKQNLSKEQQVVANDLKLVQYDITLGNYYLENQEFFKIGE